jgi:ATP-dependent RNA helicase DHX57
VFLHPGSVNFACGKFESGWLAYSEIVETSRVFVRESSMVPVYAVLLFGGGSAWLTVVGVSVWLAAWLAGWLEVGAWRAAAGWPAGWR